MTSSNVYRSTTESKLTDSLAFRLIVTALFVAVAFAITGCSGSFDPKLSGTEPATGASGITFKGHIQGGQAPIYDANVYVFQTGESGYPGAGVPANVSFITSTAPGTFNGAVNGNNYGPHVNTDSNGNFSFTLNNCTPGAGVYIVSYGGQPIYGTQNIAAGEMASMGVCPSNSTTGLFANNPFVNVTEVSTVAFAYAVGGFTAAGYDFSHISTSATNITAMNNAFNLAQQLFSINTTGGANTSSASMPGATFPAAKINTMANILADCINSGGVTSSSAPCYALFQNATSSGVANSGVIPSDTASAMINITHNAQSNVSAIYALASNIYAPYSPTLTAQPPNFVMSIDYKASGMYDPFEVAIDGNGDVYGVSLLNASSQYTPTITQIVPGAGIVGTTALATPSSMAIDQSNNVLLVNLSTSTPAITKYAPTTTAGLGSQITAAGAVPSFATAAPITALVPPLQPLLIVGPTNNVELNDYSAVYNSPYSGSSYSAATKISGPSGYSAISFAVNGLGTTYLVQPTNGYIYTFSGGGPINSLNTSLVEPFYDTIDALGRQWMIGENFNQNDCGVYGLINAANTGYILSANTECFLSTAPGYASIDGLGTGWVPITNSGACEVVAFSESNQSPLYQINVDGVSSGSCTASGARLIGSSVDQGGNLWVTVRSGSASGYMVQLLGIAAPTIQPLSVQSQKLLPTNTSFDIRP